MEQEEQDLPSLSITSLLINCLYLGVIFYASGGFIPVPELQFAIFVSIYLVILSKVSFPPVTPKRPPYAYPDSKLLLYYVSFAALIGLVLPLILILAGHFKQQQQIVVSAVPHTALLVFQIISEGVSSSFDSISFPIRAFVPIFYNAMRLFTIWSWMSTEFARCPEDAAQFLKFGRFLAVANMAFWSFNLFCFLLPVFLPLALRNYYGHLARDKMK